MKKVTLALLTLSILLALSVSSLASSGLTNAPNIRIKEGTSSNWAGYAVQTNLKKPQSNAVTDVKGSWIVPTVNCQTIPNAYSSFWIGIDGYSSGTVEQIGTDSDCSGTTPIYYAWYEMYPKFPVNNILSILPGDTINAEVQYVGSGNFKLTLTDVRTKATFTTTQKSASAKRSSAEWIAEAPWSGGVLPLANFGTVPFTGAQAALNGHTGSISDPAWQYDAITMVTTSGIVKAQPSGLSGGGTSFSITWQNS